MELADVAFDQVHHGNLATHNKCYNLLLHTQIKIISTVLILLTQKTSLYSSNKTQ